MNKPFCSFFFFFCLSQFLTSCAQNDIRLPTEKEKDENLTSLQKENLSEKNIDSSSSFYKEDKETEPLLNYRLEEEFWDTLRSGFKLERETQRQQVQTHIEWYKKNPSHVQRVTTRANPYLYYIVKELEKEKMPLELALLPIIESAYDPFAYSHGRASGLWQFIPATGRLYGLKIDWWFDGRRDIRASTRAAIKHLKRLHKIFKKDWLLAVAAYNAGEGNIFSSIRKSGLQEDKVEFWRLKVLSETSSYVPRFLAICEIIAKPDKYGIDLPTISNEKTWGVVEIDKQIDLAKAAELASISQKELYLLNPGYNQWATHPEGPHELLLPINRIEDFKKNLQQLPAEERTSWVRHKIRSGESLSELAKKYRTTVAHIKSVNGLKRNLIRKGQSLVIPTFSEELDYTMTSTNRLEKKQDRLKAVLKTKPEIHTVRKGDNLWDISRKYGVNLRTVARSNGIGLSSLLQPGQKLKIYRPASQKKMIRSERERIRKINYKVRNGESLSIIGQKFNISVNQILKWNTSFKNRKYLQPGDRLVIFVNVVKLIN